MRSIDRDKLMDVTRLIVGVRSESRRKYQLSSDSSSRTMSHNIRLNASDLVCRLEVGDRSLNLREHTNCDAGEAHAAIVCDPEAREEQTQRR